ncbi:MAG: homoserine kinase [Gemmatimonadota bacterium]
MTTNSVTAYAPGSVGNMGPGLDILGLAVAGGGDTVTATWCDEPGIHVREPGLAELPAAADRHTAGMAATSVLRQAGDVLAGRRPGIALRVTKGLPLSGGQGGSAASAVAAAVAVNRLLGHPLDTAALLGACLRAEEVVAGRHLDNIAPSLLGGCVLIRSLDPIEVTSLPVPAGLRVVLAHPDQRMRTAEARSVLPEIVPRQIALQQAANVATMVHALHTGDLALLGRAIDDRIAEPVRGPLLKGFREAKAAALAAGAFGCSISGSGPTAFALADAATAEPVGRAMAAAYAVLGIACRVRVAEVDEQGARVVEEVRGGT